MPAPTPPTGDEFNRLDYCERPMADQMDVWSSILLGFQPIFSALEKSGTEPNATTLGFKFGGNSWRIIADSGRLHVERFVSGNWRREAYLDTAGNVHLENPTNGSRTLIIDSGDNTPQTSALLLGDQRNVVWNLQKASDNNLYLLDSIGGTTPFRIDQSTDGDTNAAFYVTKSGVVSLGTFAPPNNVRLFVSGDMRAQAGAFTALTINGVPVTAGVSAPKALLSDSFATVVSGSNIDTIRHKAITGTFITVTSGANTVNLSFPSFVALDDLDVDQFSMVKTVGQVQVLRPAAGENSAAKTVNGSTVNHRHLVQNTGGGNSYGAVSYGSDAAPNVRMYKAAGTQGSLTATTSGSILGEIIGHAYDGTDYGEAAGIRFRAKEGAANNDTPGQILFLTTDDASSTLSEKGRVDEDGWNFNGYPLFGTPAITADAGLFSTSVTVDPLVGNQSAGFIAKARGTGIPFLRLTTGGASSQWRVDVSGGNFRVVDEVSSTAPVVVEYGTPTNLLYLDSAGNGRVGVRTSSPATDFHVVGSGQFAGNLGVNGPANATIPLSIEPRADSPFFLRVGASIDSRLVWQFADTTVFSFGMNPSGHFVLNGLFESSTPFTMALGASNNLVYGQGSQLGVLGVPASGTLHVHGNGYFNSGVTVSGSQRVTTSRSQLPWMFGAGNNAATTGDGYLRSYNGMLQTASIGEVAMLPGSIRAITVVINVSAVTSNGTIHYQVHREGTPIGQVTVTTTGTGVHKARAVFTPGVNTFTTLDNISCYQDFDTFSGTVSVSQMRVYAVMDQF